jgi:hypothetical protein
MQDRVPGWVGHGHPPRPETDVERIHRLSASPEGGDTERDPEWPGGTDAIPAPRGAEQERTRLSASQQAATRRLVTGVGKVTLGELVDLPEHGAEGDEERWTIYPCGCGAVGGNPSFERINGCGRRFDGFHDAQAVEVVPASTLTEARRERDGLIDPGDKLQSAASRLAEWVRGQDAPYEVAMAAIEARSAVEQWTVARSLLAEGSSRDG